MAAGWSGWLIYPTPAPRSCVSSGRKRATPWPSPLTPLCLGGTGKSPTAASPGCFAPRRTSALSGSDAKPIPRCGNAPGGGAGASCGRRRYSRTSSRRYAPSTATGGTPSGWWPRSVGASASRWRAIRSGPPSPRWSGLQLPLWTNCASCDWATERRTCWTSLEAP